MREIEIDPMLIGRVPRMLKDLAKHRTFMKEQIKIEIQSEILEDQFPERNEQTRTILFTWRKISGTVRIAQDDLKKDPKLIDYMTDNVIESMIETYLAQED